MKRVSILGVFLITLARSAGAAHAAEPPAMEAEKLTAWEWYQDVTWEPVEAPRWVDFVLPPTVFDKARLDLGDLRLYDGNGQAVPYALRVRRAQDERKTLEARQFNRVTHLDHSAELTLDLGVNPGEHNELRVLMPGKNVRRRLRLEGSNDDKNWSNLLDKVDWMAFQADGQRIDVHDFRYPFSRYRYLRVQVWPDRSLEDDKPVLESVSILHSIQLPKENVTLPATLGPREAVQADGASGSAWLIDLGARVPCQKLSFDVGEAEFVRHYSLQSVHPDEDSPSTQLAQGEWRRQRGDPKEPLEISFSEVTARRLRFVVADHRNAPLTVESVRYTAPARQVIFAAVKRMPPLRLYFGNPDAAAPNYDFAATLPEVLEPAPRRARLEEPTKNPEYQPPLLPWSERWPWLVYGVLSLASLVLLALLLALGREAIGRHDRLSALSGR